MSAVPTAPAPEAVSRLSIRTVSDLAAAARRADVLDHILLRMRESVVAPRLVALVLAELVLALPAEGAAVIDVLDEPTILHAHGDAAALAGTVAALPRHGGANDISAAVAPCGRTVLACFATSRFGDTLAFAAWRGPRAAWTEPDRMLLGSVASLLRLLVELDSVQASIARRLPVDPLTGALNRLTFLHSAGRRLDRLDREGIPGTLLLVDLDAFERWNALCGPELGDEALVALSQVLRQHSRATDLLGRIGGDRFALWLDGMDDLTAAERADSLRLAAPALFRDLAPDAPETLSLSAGIACRRPGLGEGMDSLVGRAEQALASVKAQGGAGWAVSHDAPWP